MAEGHDTDLRAYLSSLSLFKGVDGDVCERLATSASTASYDRAGRIFSEADDINSIFLVREGWVKILRETVAGKTVLFDLRGPGDLVGAVAVLDQRPMPATAMAATHVELMSFPGKEFIAMLRENPELGLNYSREVGGRMRTARDWQTRTVSSVETRIALLFLWLEELVGGRKDGELRMPRLLTRQEIADMVGTTVETSIRTLSKWSKQGLLVTEEEEFVIKDPTHLERLSQQP